jgi:serine/threonine-protein kinase
MSHLSHFRLGDRVAVKSGLYTLRQVRQGGMGIVYLLDSESTTRTAIAAKTFRPEFPPNQIVNELNLWLDLRHPNILRLEWITAIDYETAAVSPWRRMGSLREKLTVNRKLPGVEVKQILTDAIEALRYAWDGRRIMHLDLKPENMLISGSPGKLIEISDWGLARISSDAEMRRATATPDSVRLASSFMGTIPYMAPERFMPHHPLTIHADVFSLGVLAVECLSGTLPFDSDMSLIEQILSGVYISGSMEALKEVSSRWRQFLMRCIAFDFRDRFENYVEMQRAVARL